MAPTSRSQNDPIVEVILIYAKSKQDFQLVIQLWTITKAKEGENDEILERSISEKISPVLLDRFSHSITSLH